MQNRIQLEVLFVADPSAWSDGALDYRVGRVRFSTAWMIACGSMTPMLLLVVQCMLNPLCTAPLYSVSRPRHNMSFPGYIKLPS